MRYRKYGAKKTIVDGITFDSKLEAGEYVELTRQEALGLIRDLKRQVPFVFVVAGKKICKYIIDFTYWDIEAKRMVLCEAKGVPTPVWRLKWKLLKALYPGQIYEVRMKKEVYRERE